MKTVIQQLNKILLSIIILFTFLIRPISICAYSDVVVDVAEWITVYVLSLCGITFNMDKYYETDLSLTPSQYIISKSAELVPYLKSTVDGFDAFYNAAKTGVVNISDTLLNDIKNQMIPKLETSESEYEGSKTISKGKYRFNISDFISTGTYVSNFASWYDDFTVARDINGVKYAIPITYNRVLFVIIGKSGIDGNTNLYKGYDYNVLMSYSRTQQIWQNGTKYYTGADNDVVIKSFIDGNLQLLDLSLDPPVGTDDTFNGVKKLLDNVIGASNLGKDIDKDTTIDTSKVANFGDVIAGATAGTIPWAGVNELLDVVPNVQVYDDADSEPTVKPWEYVGTNDIDLDIPPKDESLKNISLIDIFPFCIPYDLYLVVSKIQAAAEAPTITIPPLHAMGYTIYEGTEIDLSQFEQYIRVFDAFIVMDWIILLIFTTRALFIKA